MWTNFYSCLLAASLAPLVTLITFLIRSKFVVRENERGKRLEDAFTYLVMAIVFFIMLVPYIGITNIEFFQSDTNKIFAKSLIRFSYFISGIINAFLFSNKVAQIVLEDKFASNNKFKR